MSTWKRVVPEQSRKGDLIEHGSLECQEKTQYRWVNLNPKIDWVCVGTTKYYKQKQQVSNDYGQTWGDVIPYQYQRGDTYETHSTDCGYSPEPIYRWTNMDISTDWICEYVPPTSQYRWVNMDISTDYICDGTTKYYKQKKQVSYDEGQTWEDVSPAEYQRGDVYETQSTDCGYTPEPIYRWVNMDITTDWICYGTTKYYKQKKQVSNDNGQTWQDVIPYEYQSGSIYETESTDCGYVPIIYRWVNMDISTDYICDGTTKYYKQKKQISFDGGQTWADVTPAVYQRGDVYETESTDCGYVPPTPTGTKLQAAYSGGQTYEVECNDNSTLTSGETKPSGYEYSAMTSAVIGDCVTSIGNCAFADCTFCGYYSSLTSVTIPDSVTGIGDSAFADCTSLTSINIPDGVTSIGYDAFGGCINLENITIPSGITYIGVGAIGETKIKSVELVGGSGLFIGSGAFYGCSSLSSLTIHNGAGTISGSAFQNCTNLKNVYIGGEINGYASSIDHHIFSGCTKIENIYLDMPEILYDLFPNVNNTINTLEFGEHVTRIANNTFDYKGNLDTLIVRATTPPRLGYKAFLSTIIRIIYVPAESVDAYKSASGWSSYSSRIQAIP